MWRFNDVPGHPFQWLHVLKLTVIPSSESERLQFGEFSGLADRDEVFIIDNPVLNDLDLVHERNAGWTGDVVAVTAYLQKWRGAARLVP